MITVRGPDCAIFSVDGRKNLNGRNNKKERAREVKDFRQKVLSLWDVWDA